MQRISPTMVGHAPLIRARNEVAQQNGIALERGVGVFDLARSFSPGRVCARHILSRIGEPWSRTGQLSAEGHEIMRISPMPEQPEEYVTPAIILPARDFKHPRSGGQVWRRVAMQMSAWFDYEEQSGVKGSLPIPTPLPDRMTLTGKVISLSNERYQEPDTLVPVETISGDYVQVYEDSDDWQPLGSRTHQMLPNANYTEEASDWNKVLAYPPEALHPDVIAMHRNNVTAFLVQLDIIEQALLDPSLNPRPARS